MVERLGSLYGNCTDVHNDNYTRNVYEEAFDDIISYSKTVSTFEAHYV